MRTIKTYSKGAPFYNALTRTLGEILCYPSLMGGLFLDIYVVYIVRLLWRLVGLFRSRRWEKATATVLGTRTNASLYSSVSVDYEYAVDGQKFADTFVKAFIWDSSAKAYADQFAKGMSFTVRIKPGLPGSIADASVENWWNYETARR